MTLIRQGDRSPDVGLLQQSLVEAGYTINSNELSFTAFGDTTTAAVTDFQARHVGPDGHRLSEDGVVGPATQWALAHPNGDVSAASYIAAGWRCNPSEARPQLFEVLRDAVGDIGKHEIPDGSNDGPDLAKFDTGGLPWCAMAVSTWYAVMDGGSPFGRIAGTATLREWFEKHGCQVGQGDQVLLGDVWIITRALGHGHTGIVAATLGPGMIATVEGNASNAVRGLIRPVSSLCGIYRPVPL